MDGLLWKWIAYRTLVLCKVWSCEVSTVCGLTYKSDYLAEVVR